MLLESETIRRRCSLGSSGPGELQRLQNELNRRDVQLAAQVAETRIWAEAVGAEERRSHGDLRLKKRHFSQN